MKLITLNTHSLEEPDYEEKLHRFVDVVLAEKPDIVAMQEVNQSAAAERVSYSSVVLYSVRSRLTGKLGF